MRGKESNELLTTSGYACGAELFEANELGDLHLTEAQEAYLVAFMKTTSDGLTP